MKLENIADSFVGLVDLPLAQRKRRVLEISRKNWTSPESVRAILQEYLARLALGKIGGERPRVTFNPNGFVKMQILNVGPTTLRLHVHCPQREVPENARDEENAHDHRWSLCSTLIAGQMEHTILGPSSEGDEYAKFSYYPRGRENSFTMNYQGTARLRETGKKISKIFSPLSMDAWLVHRVSYPSKEVTASLVVTDEDRRRDFNYVYTTETVRDIILLDGKTPAPKVPLNEAVDIVSELLQLCF